MKARVKTRVLIDADAAAVFKYLSHTKYHHLWNPQLQSVKPLVELHKGSVYNTYNLVLGVKVNSENHVTKYVQNKELELQNSTGMVQYSANFMLEAADKGTHVICTIAVATTSKTFAFARPIMEHLARRELNSDLKALKKAVETKQT